MDNLQTYKIKRRRGIDDLKGLFAYLGNSQGDESCSNELGADVRAGGWMSFVFDCERTQEAINTEVKRRQEWNENYIKELMASNEYGQEFEVTVSFIPHPLFDEPKSEMPTYSSSFIIMDLSKDA